jgi:hypothetical protein
LNNNANNNNNNNNDGNNFLNNTMGEKKENVSLVVPIVDIPKTRSKCSVVSFIYSIMKDMKTSMIEMSIIYTPIIRSFSKMIIRIK